MSAPGQVFTPSDFADALWDAALGLWRSRGGNGTPTVVEPSAGDGALVGAIQRANQPVDLTAVELDAELLAPLQKMLPTDARLVHADTLGLSRGASPSGPVAAQLGITETFGEGAERLRHTGWADIVIANPPYLRETGNAALFRAIRTWNDGALAPLYRKDADLHFFFWDVAQRWLRPGGVLAFLTPAYFFESVAAGPLRALLTTQGHVAAVYRAGARHVFSAGVEAAVTLWVKGGSGPTHVLDDGLQPQSVITLPPGQQPWWTVSTPALSALQEMPHRLADYYDVKEGISTGANAVRERHLPALQHAGVEAEVGDGVFVFSSYESARSVIGKDLNFLKKRLSFVEGKEAWVLYVKDGDFPRLDRGEAPQTAVERHLLRYKPVLAARAEMKRNASRSWYALAWPRAELFSDGAIVTPKWSKTPRFSALSDGAVPMTDARVLLPKTPAIAARRDEMLAWLNGPTVAPWYAHRLKHKGRMVEWYGPLLGDVPMPA